MRKGCDRGETEGKNKAKKTVEKKKKIKKIFVATNVVASPPPECPPTGMLTLVPKEKENISNQRMKMSKYSRRIQGRGIELKLNLIFKLNNENR